LDDFGFGNERVLEASVARQLAEKMRERETGQQDKTNQLCNGGTVTKVGNTGEL
jgi:hypothetical protein